MSASIMQTNVRYKLISDEKAEGATYTPKGLADFVADRIVDEAKLDTDTLSVLDPAAGDGELLLSIVSKLCHKTRAKISVYGFDTNKEALNITRSRLQADFPQAELHLEEGNFLDFVLKQVSPTLNLVSEAASPKPRHFDIIIANPPYVRTQIMGSQKAQILAESFGLGGRVDLYHAFLIGMAQVLRPGGIAGIIVSNRFMTTKGGGGLRAELRSRFALRQIWDLGDTKLFSAAVLPAVILAEGRNGHDPSPPIFTSIYETDQPATLEAINPILALTMTGNVAIPDGRTFRVQHGTLDPGSDPEDIWRIATEDTDTWLATVLKNTWATFGAIGKIRVGVKTCADKVFIRSDWDTLPEDERPELLRPLTTHHVANRFRAVPAKKTRAILYPHERVNGQRRAVDISRSPKSLAYLEAHRATLEGRAYVLEAGRQWYEIWVPQDPAAWSAPKLVFRDISERPIFWLDLDGSVVNGDCYWLVAGRPESEDLLWLAAAVANSTFIEAFYDHRFNNKLYAGRRRFITQYVELFPLPDPTSELAREIIAKAKAIYGEIGTAEAVTLEAQLDQMVWKVFGLGVEEVSG